MRGLARVENGDDDGFERASPRISLGGGGALSVPSPVVCTPEEELQVGGDEKEGKCEGWRGWRTATKMEIGAAAVAAMAVAMLMVTVCPSCLCLLSPRLATHRPRSSRLLDMG